MLNELRIYETMPGKLPALNDRFANHTTGFFRKHGIGMLGFWTDEIGDSNKLTYILNFDSMADREQKWNAFQADRAWQEVRAETEQDGPFVARVLNTFMSLTSYSPEPKITTNVQELRGLRGGARQAAGSQRPVRQSHHRIVRETWHGGGGLLDPGRGHQQRTGVHAGLRRSGRPGKELEGFPGGCRVAKGPGRVRN